MGLGDDYADTFCAGVVAVAHAFPEKVGVGLGLIVNFAGGVGGDVPAVLGVVGVGLGNVSGDLDVDWLGGFRIEVDNWLGHFDGWSELVVDVELVVAELVLPKDMALRGKEFVDSDGF